MEAGVLISTFERYVERVREDFAVPGIAVAIVEDDALVLAKGYGVRRLGGNEPVSGHSLFGIASISKSFTALALGMLVDEGQAEVGRSGYEAYSIFPTG